MFSYKAYLALDQQGKAYKKFYSLYNLQTLALLKQTMLCIAYIGIVLSKTEIPIIASGGVTTIDDIEKLILLTKKGLSGVIIGKAIYESRIKIKDLIILESRI